MNPTKLLIISVVLVLGHITRIKSITHHVLLARLPQRHCWKVLPSNQSASVLRALRDLEVVLVWNVNLDTIIRMLGNHHVSRVKRANTAETVHHRAWIVLLFPC